MNPTKNLNSTLFILNVALVAAIVSAAWAIFGIKGEGTQQDLIKPLMLYSVSFGAICLAVALAGLQTSRSAYALTTSRERTVTYVLTIILICSAVVRLGSEKYASALFTGSCFLAFLSLFFISMYGSLIVEFRKAVALANLRNQPLREGIVQPKATLVDGVTHRTMVERLTRELETERNMRAISDKLAQDLKEIVDRLGDNGVERIRKLQQEYGQVTTDSQQLLSQMSEEIIRLGEENKTLLALSEGKVVFYKEDIDVKDFDGKDIFVQIHSRDLSKIVDITIDKTREFTMQEDARVFGQLLDAHNEAVKNFGHGSPHADMTYQALCSGIAILNKEN